MKLLAVILPVALVLHLASCANTELNNEYSNLVKESVSSPQAWATAN